MKPDPRGPGPRDVAVLVPAAGLGTRLGPGAPKALREVAGSSLLVHALRRLDAAPSVGCIVVAAPPGRVSEVEQALTEVVSVALHVVEGGSTRQQSVAAALAVVPSGYPVILVHDAARAFAPAELVERVAAAVRAGHDAVIPVLPVVDTIKQVDEDGYVTGTPSRATLRAVQTPQGFRRAVLEAAHNQAAHRATADNQAAHNQAGHLATAPEAVHRATAPEAVHREATDDATLVERLGTRVFCVPGAEAAIKITRPADLITGEVLAG